MTVDDRQYAIGTWTLTAKQEERTARLGGAFADGGTAYTIRYVLYANVCWAVAATMLLDWLLREEGA